MQTGLYMSFHKNCALLILGGTKVVEYVHFSTGKVVLTKTTPLKFHREFGNKISDYPIEKAARMFLNPPVQGITVDEAAAVKLRNLLKENTPTKDFRVLKPGNPHRVGSLRYLQYNFLLECSTITDFLVIGKEKYMVEWEKKGWVECL